MGAVLLALLLLAGFINDLLGVARGLIPAMRLVVSLIETFAGVTGAIFLYIFHRRAPVGIHQPTQRGAAKAPAPGGLAFCPPTPAAIGEQPCGTSPICI